MTTVWLVRHAKAKNRLEWDAPDELRPRTRRGRREADAIAARLAAEDPAPERLVSSPYLRCVQTLEPLAAALGLPLETSAALGEGAGTGAAELVLSLAEHASPACCTHGDVVFEIADLVARSGIPLDGPRDVPVAAIWVLEVEDGRFAAARFVPQPPR